MLIHMSTIGKDNYILKSRRTFIMRKHFKHDCSHCQEYPDACDDCYSGGKASMDLKPRNRNKKRDSRNNNDIVNPN